MTDGERQALAELDVHAEPADDPLDRLVAGGREVLRRRNDYRHKGGRFVHGIRRVTKQRDGREMPYRKIEELTGISYGTARRWHLEFLGGNTAGSPEDDDPAA